MKQQSLSDKKYLDAKLTENNVAWMYQYCRMVIAQEQRYAKLTKSKTMLLPDFCVGIGLDK